MTKFLVANCWHFHSVCQESPCDCSNNKTRQDIDIVHCWILVRILRLDEQYPRAQHYASSPNIEHIQNLLRMSLGPGWHVHSIDDKDLRCTIFQDPIGNDGTNIGQVQIHPYWWHVFAIVICFVVFREEDIVELPWHSLPCHRKNRTGWSP